MSNLTVTSLFLHYVLFSTDAAICVTYIEYLNNRVKLKDLDPGREGS